MDLDELESNLTALAVPGGKSAALPPLPPTTTFVHSKEPLQRPGVRPERALSPLRGKADDDFDPRAPLSATEHALRKLRDQESQFEFETGDRARDEAILNLRNRTQARAAGVDVVRLPLSLSLRERVVV
jgi:hypothetical protein